MDNAMYADLILFMWPPLSFVIGEFKVGVEH